MFNAKDGYFIVDPAGKHRLLTGQRQDDSSRAAEVAAESSPAHWEPTVAFAQLTPNRHALGFHTELEQRLFMGSEADRESSM